MLRSEGSASNRARTIRVLVCSTVHFKGQMVPVQCVMRRTAFLKQTTSTVRDTNWRFRDHPKSSLPFVQSHVTHTVLHFQCNQTQPDYDTQQTCYFIAIIAMLLWFYKSFFVVYKLLYQTINGNKWGNKDVLLLFSLCWSGAMSCCACICLQRALKLPQSEYRRYHLPVV